MRIKKNQYKYLLNQTVKWFLIAFCIQFFLVATNIQDKMSLAEHLQNFYSFQAIIASIIFSFILSFAYAIIKLVSIRKRIELDDLEKKKNQ